MGNRPSSSAPGTAAPAHPRRLSLLRRKKKGKFLEEGKSSTSETRPDQEPIRSQSPPPPFASRSSSMLTTATSQHNSATDRTKRRKSKRMSWKKAGASLTKFLEESSEFSSALFKKTTRGRDSELRVLLLGYKEGGKQIVMDQLRRTPGWTTNSTPEDDSGTTMEPEDDSVIAQFWFDKLCFRFVNRAVPAMNSMDDDSADGASIDAVLYVIPLDCFDQTTRNNRNEMMVCLKRFESLCSLYASTLPFILVFTGADVFEDKIRQGVRIANIPAFADYGHDRPTTYEEGALYFVKQFRRRLLPYVGQNYPVYAHATWEARYPDTAKYLYRVAKDIICRENMQRNLNLFIPEDMVCESETAAASEYSLMIQRRRRVSQSRKTSSLESDSLSTQ